MQFTKRILYGVLIIIGLFLNKSITKAQEMNHDQVASKNSIDFCVGSAVGGPIYALQYGYMLNEKTELLLGIAYQDWSIDCGKTHAPSLLVGARQYFWKNLYLEYVLWPAYNEFYEKNEKKWYKSGELWNEFRFGYRFDFRFGGIECYAMPNYVAGFGLIGGYKPQTFKDEMSDEGLFLHPNIDIGIRF